MEIRLSKQAEKYINGQDSIKGDRIKKALKNLAEEPPIGDIKKLKGDANRYRLRIGDLRVVWQRDSNIIFVLKILPRGQVYN